MRLLCKAWSLGATRRPYYYEGAMEKITQKEAAARYARERERRAAYYLANREKRLAYQKRYDKRKAKKARAKRG